MRIFLICLTVILGLIVTGCSGPADQKPDQGTEGVKMITAEEAKTRLDKEEGIIVLDVRTEAEYKEEHIPNAVLLPIDTIEANAGTVIPDKEATYFVYCRSGNRSATASAQLVEMGYKNIYDLGGIIDWPYEKVSGQ